MILVLDELSGEERYCMGVILPYTKQRLDAILALTPFEAMSLLFSSIYGFSPVDKPFLK